MENDINNLDPEDIGLKGVFGESWRDATKEEITNKTTLEYRKPVEAPHEPVKHPRRRMSRLKDCAKWVALFGGLTFLIFYWQKAGLMHASIAVPCMCVCTALVGLGVGKNVNR